MNDVILDKARGMMIGLAVGDALGAPYEFGYTSEKISELGDEIAHFKDSWAGPAGTWTDDTSMALCLADSLIECGGYDSYDIMDRFSRWMIEGYRTPDGFPAADVGNQTRSAITNFRRDSIIHKNSPKTKSAGNGAIMRVAPMIIPRMKDWTLVGGNNKLAALSCRETHDSDEAIEVTNIFADCICWCAKMHSDVVTVLDHIGGAYDICGEIWNSNGDELKNKGGYIVDSFKIAVWGLVQANKTRIWGEKFKSGMLEVIRLGGDTDTNAAIYGQLAGACFGYGLIPEEWRSGVYMADEIAHMADQLVGMKECPILRTRFEDDSYFKLPNTETKYRTPMNDIKSIGELLNDYMR